MSETRLQRLRNNFPAGADTLIVTCPLNCRYLSGVNFTDGFLLINKEGGAYILADSRYIEVAKRNAAPGFEAVLLDRSGKAEFIRQLGGKTVAFEDSVMTCAELERYKKALPEHTFIPAGTPIEALRNIKDETEVGFISQAQRIAEKAFDHILGFITPDKTEREVALELEYIMRKNGADGIAFDTIAVSGSESSLPHGEPRDIKLKKGFLTMDFGAKYQGYCSDMTRTVCIGKPDEDMKRLYNTVLSAQTAALNAAIYGGERSAKVLDGVARKLIDDAGYKGLFSHSLGHGVGLFIHESIYVSPRSEQTLVQGNVFTVEPGIYMEGKYGVRIEDMVYIGENGAENLTKCDKSLIVL